MDKAPKKKTERKHKGPGRIAMTMARTVAAVEQGGRWAKGIVSPTGRNAEAVEKGAKYRAEIRRISKLPRDQRQAALRALSQIN